MKAFKLYGYAQSGDNKLLELREVTVCVDAKKALALSEFFAKCSREMSSNNEWQHEHFSAGGESDLIVFNSCKNGLE